MSMKAPKIPSAAEPTAARGLRLQQSTYGDAIPILWGERRVPPHLLWADRFKAHKVPSAQPTGSKGGGASAAYTYRYTVSLVFGLIEGDLPRDPDGNPYNPARPDEVIGIGLARPGNRPIAVNDTGSVADPVPGGSDGTGDTALDGQSRQPVRGTEPGAWRQKIIRHVGHSPEGSRFRGTHFEEWEPGRFVSRPGDVITDAFPKHNLSVKMLTPGLWPDTHPPHSYYAPINYPALATIDEEDMQLGANAALPNWNFPTFRMRYMETDIGPGLRDGAADRGMADLLVNWKHGAGFPMQFLPGYDPALGDASPFWQVGPDGLPDPSSWAAYLRALDCLTSPLYDKQQALSQMIDDLALLTDSAPLFSEGKLKMIPYGDATVTSPVNGTTYTPETDPTVYGWGANVGIREALTLGDLLPTEKSDPLIAKRKPILGDQRKNAGYFNLVRVEYEERLDGYAKNIAEARDDAAIETHGLVVGSPLAIDGLCSSELAHAVAERYLQRYGDQRDDYLFTLGWWFLHLEPMDLVTVPGEALDAALAGSVLTFRLMKITENERGDLEMTAKLFLRPTPGDSAGAAPDPDTSLDLGAGGGTNDVWLGTFKLFDSDGTSAGLQYMDPAGEAQPGTRAQTLVAMPGPVDLWGLYVRVAVVTTGGDDPFSSTSLIPWPAGASLILRPNVNGVPYPDIEVTVDAIGQVVGAETDTPIHLEADDELCLEIEAPGIEAIGGSGSITGYFSLRYSRPTNGPIQLGRTRFFDPGPPSDSGLHWGVLQEVNDAAAFAAPLPRDLTIHTVTMNGVSYADTYLTSWITAFDWLTGTTLYTDTRVVTTPPERWTYNPEITFPKDDSAVIRLDGPLDGARMAVIYELADVVEGTAVYSWNLNDFGPILPTQVSTWYAPFGSGHEELGFEAAWQKNPTWVRIPWAGTGTFTGLILTVSEKVAGGSPYTIPAGEEYDFTLLIDGQPTDLKLIAVGDGSSRRFEAWADIPIRAGQDVCLQVEATATLVSGFWTYTAAAQLAVYVLYVGTSGGA